MKVLVAGGTGFIGQAVVAELTRTSDHQVMSISRSATGHVAISGKVDYVEVDWREAYRSEAVLEFEPDVLINVVGTSHPRSSIGHETAEIDGALLPFFRLIDALKGKGLKRVVFASSAGALYRSALHTTVKPRADSAYFSVKLGTEAFLTSWINAIGITGIVLRVSNPLGWNRKAGFGVVSHFSRAILSRSHVEFVGDYQNFKDYVDVSDVARAFAATIAYEGRVGHCDIVDIGSGSAISAEGVYLGLVALSEGKEFPRELIKRSALSLEQTAALLAWRPRVDLIEAVSWIFDRERQASGGHIR
ncbi:MAG: NAD-dependent epimerase/dehydratase family protein [Rhodobacteraceae bacterium]|nr:NAD-dependent epimerase/dehydratase family protein [Paracoccaceae bacterium]